MAEDHDEEGRSERCGEAASARRPVDLVEAGQPNLVAQLAAPARHLGIIGRIGLRLDRPLIRFRPVRSGMRPVIPVVGPAVPWDRWVWGPIGADEAPAVRRWNNPLIRSRLQGDEVAEKIPLVDYLVLGSNPHLVANECTSCGARFFDRRNACASCGKIEFKKVDVPTAGEVRAFTIVSFAAPGVPVPYVAALVDCGGTSVRGNLINVEPDPDHVTLGMPVQLATQVIGTDESGTEAIGFGFEPRGG